MTILALESSAKPSSCAVLADGELLGQYFQNSGLTHSRTLLPMAEALLSNLALSVADIGLVAVSSGPGSFTGVRIGVSAAKGLGWGADIPVCGVSTLEAMAYQICCPGSVPGFCSVPGFSAVPDFGAVHGFGAVPDSGPVPGFSAVPDFGAVPDSDAIREPKAVICPIMDARRGQVYNALFALAEDGARSLRPGESPAAARGGKPRRLCGDRAISLEELAADLKARNAPCLLVGDGAFAGYEYLASYGIDCRMPPELMRYQTAYGVALAAANSDPIPAIELEPSYLRPSQAERLRNGG